MGTPVSGSGAAGPAASPAAPVAPARAPSSPNPSQHRGPHMWDSHCVHCRCDAPIGPPEVPMTAPPRPIRWGMKCWGTNDWGSACKRVRVFSFADLPAGRDLTEVPSILPNYPVIAALRARGGYRAEVADLLVYACDLDAVGQLEPDPDAQQAAYRGAAIYIRMAAEMFLARCALRRRSGKWGRPGGMVRDLRSGSVARVKKRADRGELADSFQWIFDFGNVSAHPRVTEKRLAKIKEQFPPVHGLVVRALSLFDSSARGLRWDR